MLALFNPAESWLIYRYDQKNLDTYSHMVRSPLGPHKGGYMYGVGR